jgi:hypothetical protein
MCLSAIASGSLSWTRAWHGEPLRYLLPNAIRVIGSTPVSVLFQAANGSWWVWNNLTSGNWTLTGALPAQRVFVLSNVGNVGAPWQIANLGITLGDYYTPKPILTWNGDFCLLCSLNQYTTVRDFLSAITLRTRTNTQAEPGPDTGVPATRLEQSARAVSDQEALTLLQRQADSHADHDGDPREILDKIPGAYGTERQMLIMEYLLATSRLPPPEQAAAHGRLVRLFEAKR